MSGITKQIVEEARRKSGLSVAEFGDKYGVTPHTARRWAFAPDASQHRAPPSESLAQMMVDAGMWVPSD
jgi:DNA-binding transcriptional regulator YiaG